MKETQHAIRMLVEEYMPADSGLAREAFATGARAALKSLAVCPYQDCREVVHPITVAYHSAEIADGFKCPCCGREWALEMHPCHLPHLDGEVIRADGTSRSSAS